MKIIENLLKVKSILSLVFCFTTCYLAIIGKIETSEFLILTSAIITYYNTKKKEEE